MNKNSREYFARHIASTMLGIAALCSMTAYAAGPAAIPPVAIDWFDVGFTSLSAGTAITAGSTTGFTPGTGSWTSAPDGVAEVVADGSANYISIDADTTELLTLAPAALASVVSNETISVEINPVAITALPVVGDLPSDPITMFSLLDNGSTVTPVAYVAGVWTNLMYAPGAQNLTNAWFTLYLDFANENGAKFVRFTVEQGGTRTVLHSAGETWFPSSNSSKTSISGLSFSGTSLCRTISGDYYDDDQIKINGNETKTITLSSNLELASLSVTNINAAGGTGTLTVSGATLQVGTLYIGEGVEVNMAKIDATTITGVGTAVYTSVVPPTGKGWKEAAWKGTVWIKNVTSNGFNPDSYGNGESTVRLTGVTGYFPKGKLEISPAIELVDEGSTVALNLNNGFSYDQNSGYSYAKFNKLKGTGTITGSESAQYVLLRVADASEFTGGIGLNNKCIVFGEEIPASLTLGAIYISAGAVVTKQGNWWAVGGIKVDGELRAANLDKLGGGTYITTSDNGVFTLTSTGNGNENETETNYARISGTGTLKYDGAGWRALSTNNFPTAVTLVNEQSGDILLSRALTYNIGSLSGSKNFQGNYGSGARYLNILQSKNTEWSGNVAYDYYSRLAGFKLDSASTGTLTLSGTATQRVPLEINGGAVNLTGTWVGATTVAGTFGGTGTLTGDLTFNAGSTFKAFATDENGLSVSGTVAYPASGTVAVDISNVTVPADGVTLISGSLPADTSQLTVAEGYVLRVESNALKVYPAAACPETLVEDAVVTPEWKEENGLTGATTEEIQAKMREKDANGNAKWQNLVLGQDGSESAAVVAATNGTETTAVIGMTFTPPANSGYTVKYALDKVDSTGAVVESATEQATPSIDLTQVTAGTPAYFKVRAVLTNDYVGSSVAVEKIIGVTKVDSTNEYTIVGVPWASFGDGDIKVSELLHVGNRSGGDTEGQYDLLMAYDPVNKDYLSGTWKLNADKVWEPATVTKTTENGGSKSGTATAADQNTIKRGSAVWLKRVNPNAPIYLLGQVTNVSATVKLAARESETEPSWNLVASSSATELNLNGGLTITPSAGDQIRVPTAGAPIDYTYEGGVWGRMKATKGANGIIQKTWTTEGATVPAGCGFWYLNTSEGQKDLGL